MFNLPLCCAQNYSYTHLSAGDLLREERSRKGSEFGQLIDNYIKEGKIVPVEITINLLKKVVLLVCPASQAHTVQSERVYKGAATLAVDIFKQIEKYYCE